MSPLLRAATWALLLFGVSRAAESRSTAAPRALETPAQPGELSSLCPSGTLPDANVCIPVPGETSQGEALASQSNAHRERSGLWRVYEQIPRRPDRPADYRRYRLPIAPARGQSLLLSGYDLDRPDAEQRRGSQFSAVGHGGIDIAQARGTHVQLINLEHQVGDAEVLYTGALFGNSVVTRHTLREASELREYLVIFGHLEGPAPGLARGAKLREGSLIGFVGDSGSPGIVHLHLEVRRVRKQVNVAELSAGELTQNAKTVVCDPRNVLPLNTH